MMKKNIYILFSLVFMMSFVVSPAISVQAHPELPEHAGLTIQAAMNAPDCYAMDIVFLIDQSLSMSRQGNPNDPLGQRFEAPRYALDWLANNRLARLGQCPDVVHRIGVISFGTDAIIELQPTKIDPDTQVEWSARLPNLLAEIEERNMGGTDPMRAFKMAHEMLDEMDTLGPVPRKRAIILLTDGQPCVPGQGCGEEGGYVNLDEPFYKTYMKEFIKYADQAYPFAETVKKRDKAVEDAIQTYRSLALIPEEQRNQLLIDYPVTDEEWINSTYFWVIAMNDASPYLDDVGEYFEELSENRDGDLIDLKQNLGEIPRIFGEVMSEMAGVTPTLLSCGNLAVDPYLSGVVLDIYKVAVGLEVEIKYNGKSLKSGAGDTEYFGLDQYGTYGITEHYRFLKPPAGLWEVVCSDPNGAQVSYLPFNATVQMIEPSHVLPQYDVNNTTSDPAHPSYMSFKIVDQTNGETLDLDVNYPLDLTAIITDPSGITLAPMNFSFKGAGLWVSDQPVPVNLVGEYQVSLTGIAACVTDPNRPERCESPTLKVIEFNEGRYKVEEVSLFQIVMVKPEPDSTFPLHGNLLPDFLKPENVTVQVQLLDMDGQPIQAEQILTGDAEGALNVVMEAGSEVFEKVLRPDPTDGSRFTAEFDQPQILGEHTLRVTMADVYNFEKYRPQENPITVVVNRKDPLLRNLIFYKVLLAFLSLVLSAYVIYLIRLRTFKLRGYLTFSKEDKKGQLGLGKGKRWFTLRGKKIPAELKGDFRKIQVSNLPMGNGNRSRIEVVLKSPHRVQDESTFGDSGWTFTYTTGAPNSTRQKDRFGTWTIVTIVAEIAIIAGIFLAH